MSRCLPYTPSMKAVDREALLEPIKPQRELEKKPKTHRKMDKKERKEKKDKKEKKKKEEEKRKVHKDDELSTFAVISRVDAKGTLQQDVESNQLERSDITEEHELPILSENICYLSDGTRSSTKRKSEPCDITEEHELPILSENICYLSDGTRSSTKRKRTIIRIKSLPKCSDPQSSNAPCAEPTSRSATDLKTKEVVHAPSAETNVEFENAASTSDQKVSSFEDHLEGLLHQSMIGNWGQPLCQSVLDDHGDEDWLFERKQDNRHGSKRFKASNDVVSGCTSHSMWPQACWLPEPGLAALPFTVPF